MDRRVRPATPSGYTRERRFGLVLQWHIGLEIPLMQQGQSGCRAAELVPVRVAGEDSRGKACRGAA
jgi:hypothetical protein